jgi:hypothetical protein
MHKPLGIFAFTNLVREESEWQSVSESPSTGAYVGFLFACYSTPTRPTPRETGFSGIAGQQGRHRSGAAVKSEQPFKAPG